MSGSTSKKVVAIRFDRAPVAGFVNPAAYLQDIGIEVLTADGNVLVLPYGEVKLLLFVRDFDQDANRSFNRSFATRPKTAGLWVRLLFQDSDTLEGVVPNNLLVFEPHGFSIAPPDAAFLNQRLFVPRAALKEMQVLGVIGSPLRKRPAKAAAKDQLDMFEGS